MKNNIALIGMMGCGKSTIGKELQKHLPEYSFVDIDELIESSTQKKISEIFLKYGEHHFRVLENDKIKSVLKNDFQIISLGGGAFEDPENRDLLLSKSCVIFLKASPQAIFDRIKNETHRPLLRRDFSVEKIQEIMQKRLHNYEKAHFTIDTTEKTPYNIVNEILGVFDD